MADLDMKAITPTRPIVVNCGTFDENTGGTIVLHTLVDRLRKLGVEAYAVPLIRQYRPSIPGWQRWIRTQNQKRKARLFKSHPSMDVPVAPAGLARSAIAIYPEVISGNPLGAPVQVHWLLNRPGFFGKPLDLAESDAVFFYQAAFCEGTEGVPSDNLLRVRWLRHDVYENKNLPGRSGACRMLRKGSLQGSNAVPEDDTAIPLDGKSHEELAEIFNRTEIFYCHDPYTMYCYYAALCGCVPVIIPEPGLTSREWRETFELKQGVAYGLYELQWARDTREGLLSDMQVAQTQETEMVQDLLKKLKAAFG